MRNQSKLKISGELAHVELDPEFPVSLSDFNTRNDNPSISAHIHDALEIGYCFDGEGVFLIDSKVFHYRSGDAVVINSHEAHIAKSDPDSLSSWGFLYLDPVKLLSQNLPSVASSINVSQYCGRNFKNIIDGREYPDLTGCIRRILLERRDRPLHFRSMIRSLTWQLLLFLKRYASDSAFIAETGGDYNDVERIMPALNYVHSHFSGDVNVSKLAALCNSSESNFRKLFQKALGCAPQPYLMKLRLHTACAMLRNTQESILDIATQCGYRNLSNFNRQFQENFAMSPRQYRAGGGGHRS